MKFRSKPSEEKMKEGEFRLLRKEVGLTQAELAIRWKVAASTIYKWESGKTEVPFPIAVRLAFKELQREKKEETA